MVLPRNRLVKRSTSHRLLAGRSLSQSCLDGPATSHRRSFSLQRQVVETSVPSRFAWRPYFAKSEALVRKRVRPDQRVVSAPIHSDTTEIPTLVLAASLQALEASPRPYTPASLQISSQQRDLPRASPLVDWKRRLSRRNVDERRVVSAPSRQDSKRKRVSQDIHQRIHKFMHRDASPETQAISDIQNPVSRIGPKTPPSEPAMESFLLTPSPPVTSQGHHASHFRSRTTSGHDSTLLGSDNEVSRLFLSDDEDGRSDTLYDSTRTGATGSISRKRPHIETIFDNSPPPRLPKAEHEEGLTKVDWVAEQKKEELPDCDAAASDSSPVLDQGIKTAIARDPPESPQTPDTVRHYPPAGQEPRPKTGHGLSQRLRAGSTLHVRSQSVPASQDGRHLQKPSKLESWVLGKKGPSEDWDGDFDFDEPRLVNDCMRPSLSSGMLVPSAILDRQASVHGQFSQVRELTQLVEDLKRLQQQARVLGLTQGQAAELWKEAEGIITLATLDEGEMCPSVPSSVEDSEDFFGEARNSIVSSTDTEEFPFVDESSSARAKAILQTIQPKKELAMPTEPHQQKLRFDTTSLTKLVIRAGVVTRALKEEIRRAEQRPTSLHRSVTSDPPFSRIFLTGQNTKVGRDLSPSTATDLDQKFDAMVLDGPARQPIDHAVVHDN